MKLVINKIGTPGIQTRTIIPLERVSEMTLDNSGGIEQLGVTLDGGVVEIYETADNMFGLSDGHGSAAAMTPNEVMNAFLMLGEELTGDKTPPANWMQ